ncbi:hypothetical protein [Proteus faecis]|uniref:hypothetical protein n=1 Tax=Proteus faecis TaxID=2050967 RepID=UPI00301D0396
MEHQRSDEVNGPLRITSKMRDVGGIETYRALPDKKQRLLAKNAVNPRPMRAGI